MANPPKNMGASVRAQLLNAARDTGEVFDVLLTRFVHERLLYRLSLSSHADRFALKGAMLLSAWMPEATRGTRDLDLLGFGDSDEERILRAFRDVLTTAADDGVEFDPDALRVSRIREEMEYGGLRVRTIATVAGARIAVVVDIGFGDSVEPGLEVIDYPVLLNLPAPTLRTYARETVVAEKFQAMVALGRINSRMKDFYDIWLLSKNFTFQTERLARAIAATFTRRHTPIPAQIPDALTPELAADLLKQRQWSAFIVDLDDAPKDLLTIVSDLAAFLMPAATSAREPS